MTDKKHEIVARIRNSGMPGRMEKGTTGSSINFYP